MGEPLTPIRNCGRYGTEGMIGVLARSVCVCDHLGFVTRKGKKTTLVAHAKQYAVMRAMLDEEFQALHKAVEYMNESQEKRLVMTE